jgi:hypothetical protein
MSGILFTTDLVSTAECLFLGNSKKSFLGVDNAPRMSYTLLLCKW